ncbi:MAG: transglutaminase-like domain-containing protein [Candidatus Dormibacteria bacterium]
MAVQEVAVPLRQGDNFGAEPGAEPGAELGAEEIQGDAPRVPLLQVALASGLATAAAAWMVGGMFNAWQARAIGIFAAVLGAGLSYGIYRLHHQTLQFVVPLVGLLVGAVFVAPDAHAGTSSLPALVVDAIRTGGFLQPPVEFAPGWRLILTALFVVVASGGIGVAVSTSRPRLAPVVAMPLALGAALVQPPGAALLSSAVTIVGLLAAFAISYGADLGHGMGEGGGLGAGFELRRLGRTVGMVAALLVAVVALNQAGFLFPSPDQNRIVPPQRPQVPPDPKDVPLFKVITTAQTPYRLGVIDVYDSKQGAWLLPEQDNRRLRRLGTPATLPGGKLGAQNLTATFVVERATGHLLPLIGGTVKVEGLSGQQLEFDPRQQTIRLAGKPLFTGLRYTVEAPPAVGGADLRKASAPPKDISSHFLSAPAVPLEVQTILEKAPSSNSFDRLQYVRQTLYDKVVAAGSGKPVDVSAKRAVQVMQGEDASPYEITATEALLARWAGIPSRIGYGYYGGQKSDDGSVEIRPKNGATWLEVYFGQYGWIPIIGTPPQAKASTSTQAKNNQSTIRAVDALALIVYLPARVHTLLPLYVLLRYWLAVAIPFVLAVVLLAVFYPGFVKVLRSRRRRRWARDSGVGERIAVAYAELRDRSRDLAIGDPMATPLEFLDYVEDDREHRELAWLVTRGLYGDLWQKMTEELAEFAEKSSLSVTRRLTQGQPRTTRILAFAARNSLRDPYSPEVPNLWRSRDRVRRARLRPRLRAGVAAALAALALGGCTSGVARQSRPLPARMLPDRLGVLNFVEEPKAEAAYVKARSDADIVVSEGRVYTIHQGEIAEGSVQVSRFKAGFSGTDAAVAEAIRHSIGHFNSFRGTKLKAWILVTDDQRLYMWFPPHSDSMALLIMRNGFTAKNSDAVARALINYQAGAGVPPELSLGPDDVNSGRAVQPGSTFSVGGQ